MQGIGGLGGGSQWLFAGSAAQAATPAENTDRESTDPTRVLFDATMATAQFWRQASGMSPVTASVSPRAASADLSVFDSSELRNLPIPLRFMTCCGQPAASKYNWGRGTGFGSKYNWDNGTGLGSKYNWEHGTGPGSKHNWEHGTGPGSKHQWDNGTGPGSKYQWENGTGPGSRYQWENGTGSGR